VRDAWQLLDLLGIERMTVIGTSMGGVMAMIMADQQPERLRGVVLNDIGPEVPPATIARLLTYVGLMPVARDWDEAGEQVRRAYEIALPGMPASFWPDYARLSYRLNAAGHLEPDSDPAIGELLRRPPRVVRWLQWLRRHGLLRRIGGVALDQWDSFRALTMPCLLIHGVISDVLTADIIRRMREVKPDLEVVDVENRGHTPQLDEPQALAAIDAFLERIHGGPQAPSVVSPGAT
jgi:pimeloyl-ACP methyl ester carboxylesterase